MGFMFSFFPTVIIAMAAVMRNVDVVIIGSSMGDSSGTIKPNRTYIAVRLPQHYFQASA